jgi:4-amino-4-deoxy-L-arabinose transferase-like glycosyltransferase
MDPAPRTDDAAVGTRRFAVLLALAAFLLVFGVRSLYIPFALGPDEGDYATATMQAMRGESLYGAQRSARPPLLYAEYASFMRVRDITGQPIDVTVHALAALLAAAAVALLAFSLGRRFGRLPAAVGALLAVMLAASPGLQAVDANAETLMMLPYTAAALLMWRWARGEHLDRPWLEGALAGALTVIAIMTKQVAGVLVFQLVVALVLRRRDIVALAGSFVAAAGAATLATVGWVASTGQLREWIVYGWLQNFMYAQNAAGPERLRTALEGVWRLRAIIVAPLALTTAVALWPQRDRDPVWRADTHFALWWLLLSAVPTTISGFFFPHYFIQLIPALALLGALAATRVLAWRHDAGRTKVATAVTALILVAALAGPALHLAKAFSIYPQLPIPTDSNLKPEVAAWVGSLTKPSDRVLMWSHLRGLSVYADRLPANAVPEASLYTMRSFTIYGRNAGTTVLGVPLVEPMDMIIAQWRARPPDAILVTTKTGQTLEDLARESGLRDDAALIGLLRGYQEVGRRTFDGLEAVVYARR